MTSPEIIQTNYILIIIVGLLLLSILSMTSNTTGLENDTSAKEVTLQDCYNMFAMGFMIVKFLSVNETITKAVDNVMLDPEAKEYFIETCELYKRKFGHYINATSPETESKLYKELSNNTEAYLKQELGLEMPISLKKLLETVNMTKLN